MEFGVLGSYDNEMGILLNQNEAEKINKAIKSIIYTHFPYILETNLGGSGVLFRPLPYVVHPSLWFTGLASFWKDRGSWKMARPWKNHGTGPPIQSTGPPWTGAGVGIGIFTETWRFF